MQEKHDCPTCSRPNQPTAEPRSQCLEEGERYEAAFLLQEEQLDSLARDLRVMARVMGAK